MKCTRRDKVYQTHLLRRTYRDGSKVKHQTLGNISHLPPHIIDVIKGALRGETYVPTSAAFNIVRSLPHGHVAAVLGTLRRLDLERGLATRPSRQRDLAVAMIVSQVIDPGSELATCRGFRDQTRFSSLGETLGLGSVDEDNLYAALDWLAKRQPDIEGKLAKRHLSDGSLVLYDVTSTYYTGRHCSLAKLGHNRDRKRGFPQILFGLLCNGEGCPIAVEVFEGNVADPKTLSPQIDKVRQRFGLERVILVGDRGMITEARLREELSPEAGLYWISALRGPAIRELAQKGNIQLSLFDQRDLAEVTSPDYPGERLICCRNPLLAEERARKREDLLQGTEKELNKIVAATQREKRRLRGKGKIGLRVGKVLNRYKVGKHFKLEITEEGFSYQRNSEKIAAEAALDGVYVIRTSVPADTLNAEETVRRYKDLSAVEQAFRSLKMIDIRVRPIYHRLPDRVRGHILLCMLAYYVVWHMRRALAPMLFEDEDKEIAEALRYSVVSPARRSPSAEGKARTKRTADGGPAHSFQTLLKDLSTIVKNRVQPKISPLGTGEKAPEFAMVTIPTPVQRRAFDLLRVSLVT
ncbi:IS1634 family transposase [Patescibacteria group bacterium]|nr:IS1634 family transposase [Patescibacteria group bacterium]